jgi:hypothetical protein
MGARTMDDQLCRRFFFEPQLTVHRRYEALRAIFVEQRSLEEIAAPFGDKPAALNVMVSRFRAQCQQQRIPPFSSLMAEGDHRADGSSENSSARKRPPSLIRGS